MKLFITAALIILAGIININTNSFSKGNSSASDSIVSDVKMSDSVSAEKEPAVYCLVTGEKVEGSGVQYNYLGTNVVFCCNGCAGKFKKNPAKYLKEGVIDPVCGMEEGNSEITATVDNVKYYFCSESCKKKFEADSKKYLEKNDK